MSEPLYYLQNVERGYVGNSLQWWKWDNNGYTCDIRAAKKFTADEIKELTDGRKKYKGWKVDFIDNLVQHHIDMQDVRAGREKPHTVLGVPSPPSLPWQELLEAAKNVYCDCEIVENEKVKCFMCELREILRRFPERGGKCD